MTTGSRLRLAAYGAWLVAAAFLSGCVDGDVTHREDGKRAAVVGAPEPGLSDMQAKDRAAQLMRDHPGLPARDALQQARAEAAATHSPAMRSRAELERAQTQEKFEDELVKLGE